jgi:hypothetical protein
VLNLLGYVVDSRWHAAHGSSFQSTWDQVEAHWLFWLGAEITIAVCLGVLMRGDVKGDRGYLFVLVAGAVSVPASIWTFGPTRTT